MYLLKTDVGLSQMRHLCSSIIIFLKGLWYTIVGIRVITKLANSEKSNKGKVKTHKYINRQNQSTTEICDVRYITLTRKSRAITDTACDSEQIDIY